MVLIGDFVSIHGKKLLYRERKQRTQRKISMLQLYPMGMIIPGRASSKAFSRKRLFFGKTEKLNRDEYHNV